MSACPFRDGSVLPGEEARRVRTHGTGGAEERLARLECDIRRAVGGVEHIKGLCMCCGGALWSDPEGLIRREAARLAAGLYGWRYA